MVNHMRHTRGHTRNRRSHHALKGVGFILCVNCGQPKLKHIACSACGLYKGNNTLAKKEKLPKAPKAVKAEKKVKVAKVKKATKAPAKK
jgi:large subunit ribosomal protein L32